MTTTTITININFRKLSKHVNYLPPIHLLISSCYVLTAHYFCATDLDNQNKLKEKINKYFQFEIMLIFINYLFDRLELLFTFQSININLELEFFFF